MHSFPRLHSETNDLTTFKMSNQPSLNWNPLSPTGSGVTTTIIISYLACSILIMKRTWGLFCITIVNCSFCFIFCFSWDKLFILILYYLVYGLPTLDFQTSLVLFSTNNPKIKKCIFTNCSCFSLTICVRAFFFLNQQHAVQITDNA